MIELLNSLTLINNSAFFMAKRCIIENGRTDSGGHALINQRCGKSLLVILLIAFLLLALSTLASAQPDGLIKVYTRDPVVTINADIFGQNVIATVDYGFDGGGLWDPNADSCGPELIGCYREDAKQLLIDAGVTAIRYPGGITTRSFDYTQAIGPESGRGYFFGIEEFLVLCEAVNAEPIITINMYNPVTGKFADDTALGLAEGLVEYLNGSGTRVTYFEMDSDLQNDWRNPQSGVVYWPQNPVVYATAFYQFSQALKTIDSTIKLGANSFEDDPNSNRFMLERFIQLDSANIDYWPDYMVLHYQKPNFDFTKCDLCGLDLDYWTTRIFDGAFSVPFLLNDRIDNIMRDIYMAWADYPTAIAKMYIALTSYNTQLMFADYYTNWPCDDKKADDDSAPPCPYKTLRHSLGSAIYIADQLLVMSQRSDVIKRANLYVYMDQKADDLDGTLGSVYDSAYSGGPLIERPIQLMMRLLGPELANLEALKVETTCHTFPSEGLAFSQIPPMNNIQIADDENFIRINIVRDYEPDNFTHSCPGFNPDNFSYITGKAYYTNFVLENELLPSQTNLVTNGDFTNGTAGWTIAPDPAGVLTTVGFTGDRYAMSLEFDEAIPQNSEYRDIFYQIIPLSAGEAYRLSFETKTENLTAKTRNLLCDPGFDLSSSPGAFNSGYWNQIPGSPIEATIIDSECFSPPNCLQLHIVGNPEYYHIMQVYPIFNSSDRLINDPTNFIVSAQVRTSDLLSGVSVEAQARDVGNNIIAGNRPTDVGGTTDWIPIIRELDITYQRASTSYLLIELRRVMSGFSEDGYADFDDVKFNRNPKFYLPHVEADICKDANCIEKRTLSIEGISGTRDWTTRQLSGVPYLQTFAARGANVYKVVVVNKSSTNALSGVVQLYQLFPQADRNIYETVVSGPDLRATNELDDGGTPQIEVQMTGPNMIGTLPSGQTNFTHSFQPLSVTLLSFEQVSDDDDDDNDTDIIDDDDDNDTDDDTTIDDDSSDDDSGEEDDDDTTNDDIDDDTNGDDDTGHPIKPETTGGENVGCCGGC